MDARVRCGKKVVWEGSCTGDIWVPRYIIKTASDTFREVPHALEWTNLPLCKLYLSILNKIHSLFRPWFETLIEAAHPSSRCVKACNGMLTGILDYTLIILNELPFCNSRFRTAAPIPNTLSLILNFYHRIAISEYPFPNSHLRIPPNVSHRKVPTPNLYRHYNALPSNFDQQYSETMEWHILEEGDTGQEG